MILAGQKFQLECLVDTFPSATVTWYHNGQKLKSDNSNILIFNEKLIIGSVEVENAGNYFCKVRNNPKSNEISLNIESTGFLSSPGKMTSEREGNELEMKCIPESGSVYWKHENLILRPGETNGRFAVNLDGSFMINIVRKSDLGDYSCISTSGKEALTFLQIIGKIMMRK